MEHKRCYAYEPDVIRAAKRTRLDQHTGLHASWPLRRKFFEKEWAALELKIEQSLTAVNNVAAEQIRQFVEDCQTHGRTQQLPTCVVSVEPGSKARDVLTSLTFKDASGKTLRHAVLKAAEAPDLKSALKRIVKHMSDTPPDDNMDEEDEEPQQLRRRTNALPYDLQNVADEIDNIKDERCLVLLPDAEAFRPDVLSELLDYLPLWLDRIPLVLVICCAVPIDMFQRALTQRALRKLKSKVIRAASRQDELEIVLDCTINSHWNHLFIGPSLLRSFLQRQHDFLTDVGTFISSWKYAAMCAHYANPLLTFSVPSAGPEHMADLCEALRTTDSFRNDVSQLLETRELSLASQLLDDDSILAGYVRQQTSSNTDLLRHMYRAVGTLAKAQTLVHPEREALASALWLQCLSGTLKASSTLRHFYLGVRKASRAVLEATLGLFDELVTSYAESADDDTHQHARITATSIATIRTKHERAAADDSSVTPGTNRQTSSLNADVASLLEEYFSTMLQNPRDLSFHEIYLYDTPSPCREVLTPRPRHALERALASPHDYLDCECCAPENADVEAGSLSSTQPATAILYQLYLEAGNLLNVHDAWQAFSAVVGDERAEEQKMALFQQALANLRHIGAVRSTKRRVDHIAKTAWKGL